MDVSTCKAIVDYHLPKLMTFWSLGHWRITPVFERLDGVSAGQCWPDPDYESARIIFDAEKFDGPEEQVVDLIVHELIHVLASPFTLYQRAVSGIMQVNEEASAWSALSTIATHAEEQVAINLERVWGKHLIAIYYEMATRPD